MVTLKKLREELDELKKEIMERHVAPDIEAATAFGAKASSNLHEAAEHQISELNRLVKTMLDEAETTVADHPVATVAGALALGIAIGRLTAR
jgi:ElaB/YqjD/DUF883 family membrane-anchored ribosome-binding protein